MPTPPPAASSSSQHAAECHGESGEGNPAIGAPNIAGMNEWYIETELHKFRSGVRGAEFNDVEGMRMRPMSLSLANDDEVKAVAAVCGSLPASSTCAHPGRRSGGGKTALRAVQRLPWTERQRKRSGKSAADCGCRRLVSGHGTEEISQRRARSQSERCRRLSDGAHDPRAE